MENVKNAFREKGKRKANRNKTIKVSFIPKGKLENGYRREKVSFIPKGKLENGYRKEKVASVPKGEP